MYNNTEERKYKRIELEKSKYKEIVTPYIARFRVKQYEGQEKSSLDWTIVAWRDDPLEGVGVRDLMTATIFRVKQCEGQEKPSLDWNIVAVKNLSAGGIIFNYYNENIEIGTFLDLKIDFVKSIPTINCIGRVIRIEESRFNSMFRIATEFTEIDEQEREMINTTVEAILSKEAKKKNFYLEKLEKMKNAMCMKSRNIRSKVRKPSFP